MKPCTFRTASSNPDTVQNGLSDRCRVALLMKKSGYPHATIKTMMETDGWREYKNVMPPDILNAITCELQQPDECPLGSYLPEKKEARPNGQ